MLEPKILTKWVPAKVVSKSLIHQNMNACKREAIFIVLRQYGIRVKGIL